MGNNQTKFKAPVIPSNAAHSNNAASNKDKYVVMPFLMGMKAAEVASVLSKQMNSMAELGYKFSGNIPVNNSESVIVYSLQ